MESNTPTEATIVYGMTAKQITDLFESLQKQISEVRAHFEPKIPTEYLTRTEVAKLLKCDLSTVHNWTKKGTLTPLGIGGRVYYRRGDIEAKLTQL